MSKHTPGEWVTKTGNGWAHIYVDVKRGSAVDKTIAACAIASNLSECEANARLIAAAPDLLAALIALDECYCEAGNELSKSERHQHRLVLIDARAAIAKATGAA